MTKQPQFTPQKLSTTQEPSITTAGVSQEKSGVEKSYLQAATPVTLDPAVLDAIKQAVGSAIAAIAVTPAQQATPASKALPTQNLRPNVPKDQPYVTRLKGIPVEPGEDLRHVPANVVKAWFHNLEERWKENYNRKKVSDGSPVNVSWTRG